MDVILIKKRSEMGIMNMKLWKTVFFWLEALKKLLIKLITEFLSRKVL